MAGKTELTAAFLILNVVFFTFASGQLLASLTSCIGDILQVTVCGTALNLVKIGGITDVVTGACFVLLTTLTPLQAGKCLCAIAKINVLALIVDVNIPGDINLLLKACGKQVELLEC
ncbi:14 kDa proline-rich protein DC2.15-like [Wolffia australiana]